ncbi:uridine kinase [Thermosipho africanus H17ap60334]|jgi:uridine kinase|uniref:Uridine kinase n=1 Tax=Thermosipho africanus (strain TCF52B) TaxID=484019 RepID=B7ID74_THEAB|nr:MULTISPECIES: uridine kinase [Thermosipho]HCF38506.1 uridine kinase [Thermosipho africanus]ACJ75951.1 udk uridine kinase [Thermosipho africanus TCF52B]EKF49609.1 uridine kinase [Thermosipho africanus H17ap60334]MBZ4650845.1 udk uridine kinase [Thermosipho sp. (in: thermotogales)]MDK2839753.1 uridine kinase [Thermosipho sp. (in: thermotogales)]
MFIIGIGGGTGSGKTTVAQKINEIIGESNSVILPMDNYYKDMSHVPFEERKKYNYDHPDMIEFSLLVDHLKELLDGKSIKLPEYDFAQYTRTGNFTLLDPKPVIIIEGIFALYYEELRKFYDLSIFVDAESDVRFIRRLERDIKERGRTIDSVINQYLNMVKPMHDAYVEPSKKYADLIIPRGGFNEKAINVVVEFIFKKMSQN